MTGFTSPNYTNAPNDLFDVHMKDMGECELKVVLHAIRQTMGYHKKSDEISITQFQKATGLSRQGVIDGIEAAKTRGLIEELGTGKRGVKKFGLVIILDQSENQTSSGQQNRPVDTATSQKSRHTKEIKKKEKEKKKESPDVITVITSESTQPSISTPSKKKTGEVVASIGVNGVEADKNPQTPNSARPLSPKKTAQNLMHGALLLEFGLKPENMTKTADSLYWSVAAELWQFPLERVHELYVYVKRKAQVEQWNTFGVKALAKHAPNFLRDHPTSKVIAISEPEPLAMAAGAENMQRLTPEQIAEMDRIEAELSRKFGMDGGR